MLAIHQDWTCPKGSHQTIEANNQKQTETLMPMLQVGFRFNFTCPSRKESCSEKAEGSTTYCLMSLLKYSQDFAQSTETSCPSPYCHFTKSGSQYDLKNTPGCGCLESLLDLEVYLARGPPGSSVLLPRSVFSGFSATKRPSKRVGTFLQSRSHH